MTAAHAIILAQREALLAKYRALLIEKLKFTIARLRHAQFGQSSERGAALEQLELQLADLEEDAAAAEVAAQMAAAAAASERVAVRSFQRRKPARRPLPCRANGSSIRRRRRARAAAARYASSART